MKITVIGMGYVGLSNAILLSQKHEVISYDIDSNKVEQLNKKVSPIVDTDIEDFLKNKKLQLSATSDRESAIIGSDIIIVATPTNYDIETNYFNTDTVESVVEYSIKINPTASPEHVSTVLLFARRL